jgi:hypothetical protein
MNERWRREYVSEPVAIDPARTAAIELWCWYHVTCEAFDRTVCTAPMRHGSAMPATFEQRAAIEANARKVRAEITRVAEARGLAAEVLDAARRTVGGWTDAQQTAVATRATWIPWAVREACGYAGDRPVDAVARVAPLRV